MRALVIRGLAAVFIAIGLCTAAIAGTEAPPPRFDYEPSPSPLRIELPFDEVQRVCEGAKPQGLAAREHYEGCAFTFRWPIELAPAVLDAKIKEAMPGYVARINRIEDAAVRAEAMQAISERRCVTVQTDSSWSNEDQRAGDYLHERRHCNGWRHR